MRCTSQLSNRLLDALKSKYMVFVESKCLIGIFFFFFFFFFFFAKKKCFS